MDQPSPFATLQESISAALIATTRSATQLSAADVEFQRSLDPEVATSLDNHNARLLALVQRLLAGAASGSGIEAPKLPDTDAIDGSWRAVVDVVDGLLEKADTSLDEYTGAVKRLSPGQEQASIPQKPKPLTNALRPRDLPKPQALFEHVPKNDETGGFRPLISSKPHAKVALEDSLTVYTDGHGYEQYPHPYQIEIETYQYPSSVYTEAEPILYSPFEESSATFVDSPEALAMMLAELKTAKEIAIDLEHHDNRTYVGIVSLMQISTRNKDWIIDTLKPWRRRLECLNEVFADPSVLKVLHGAYMDIIWLQRDLGLYVVGLFDTHHAARTLGYSAGSLAFLLQKFVNFQAQKQYQMADWRIRPLPQELLDYARSDTHFLLYVYDNMRNELIDRSDFSDLGKDKVHAVLEKSREVALRRYEHPIYEIEEGQGPVGWYKMWTRSPAMFTKEAFAVFKAVHQWRDQVARQEDDSTNYVMAPHAVFSIARTMPTDKAALLAVAQPISPVLRQRADDLVSIIAKAKAEGAHGPDMESVISKIENQRAQERAQRFEDLVATETAPLQPASAIRDTAPITAPLDALPIRTPTSQFWGKTFPDSVWQNRRTANSSSNIHLALPLPPLTAEIFADPHETALSDLNPSHDPAAVAEHAYVAKKDRPVKDEDEGIFVIKELGKGKKRKISEAAASPIEPPAIEDLEEISLLDSTAQRKAEKRAARKLAKQQKAIDLLSNATASGELNEDAEPFDYANAPSVLRVPNGAARDKEKKKGKKGEFNPYARAGDAPRGLGRSQKEGPGRSKTFMK